MTKWPAMKHASAARVQPRPDRRAGLPTALLLAAMPAILIQHAAWGRTQAPAPTHGAVVHPPANVDPGMKVKRPPHVAMPTPVIHPLARSGNTLIVPK